MPNLKSATILKRKPNLKLCPNHFEDETTKIPKIIKTFRHPLQRKLDALERKIELVPKKAILRRRRLMKQAIHKNEIFLNIA